MVPFAAGGPTVPGDQARPRDCFVRGATASVTDTRRNLRTHCGQSHALSPLRRAIQPAAFASSRLPEYEPQSNQAIRTFSSLCAALSHASCSASRSAPILSVSIPLQTKIVTVKSWRAALLIWEARALGLVLLAFREIECVATKLVGAFYCPRVQSPEFWSRPLGLRGRHRLFSRCNSARTPILHESTAPNSQVADPQSWHSCSRLEPSPSRCHR